MAKPKKIMTFCSNFIELSITIASSYFPSFAIPGAILGFFYPKVSDSMLSIMNTNSINSKQSQHWIFISKSSNYINTIENMINKILSNPQTKKKYNYNNFSIDILDNLLDFDNYEDITYKDILYTVYINIDDSDYGFFQFEEDFRQINFSNKITYSSNNIVSSSCDYLTKEVIYRLSNNKY